MSGLLAGIDVGTSGVKAGLFDQAGRLVGAGRASHRVEAPRPGWAECDPEGWWRGLAKALGEACAAGGASPGDIAAVGLSVLYPAVMPLDRGGRVLHPAILYCDQRSLAQVAAVEESIPRDDYERVVGNRLVPGTCAVTSIAWLRDERPEAYAGAEVIGFANTFVLSRLTGRLVTDPSNATVSGLADVRDPWRWSEELCERLGVESGLLPEIVGSAEVAGTVTGTAARETGLARGTPVTAGSGDVVASAAGAGLAPEGTAVDIAGSSDSLAVPMTKPSGERSCVNSAYAARGAWLGIGTTTSGGASVEWFAREFLGGSGAEALALMTDLAASSTPGAGGVLFTPYLQGERTPIWDPKARGGFFGLTAQTTRADLARAVFEGTAFSFRQSVESLESFAGTRIGEIRAVGGGTKNALWMQAKADVLQRELRVLRFQETGTLGAALLAGLASGVYGSFQEAVAAAAGGDSDVVEPDPARADRYQRLFELYSDLYPQTRETAHGLADVPAGTP